MKTQRDMNGSRACPNFDGHHFGLGTGICVTCGARDQGGSLIAAWIRGMESLMGRRGRNDFIGFEAMAANNRGRNDLCAETGIERHWREEAERADERNSQRRADCYLHVVDNNDADHRTYRPPYQASFYNQSYWSCMHDPAGLRQGQCPQCVALQDVRAKTALTKAAKKGRK